MKAYAAPEMEIIRFENTDIIITSDNNSKPFDDDYTEGQGG